MELRELAKNRAGAFIGNRRRLNVNLDDLVAPVIFLWVLDSLFAQPELLLILRSLRHLQNGAPVDRGYFDLCA